MTDYHFYSDLARFYDSFYEGKKFKEEAEYFYSIIKSINDNPLHSVLDIGCGTGSHLIHLSEYFEEVSGLDPSPDMLDIARNKIKDRATLFQCRIQEFKHQPAYSAVVSFNSALNYLVSTEDLTKAFQNIYNALAKNGVIVVQLHNCIDKDFLFCKDARFSDERLIVVGDWSNKNSSRLHHVDFFYHLYSKGTWENYHDTHIEYLFNKDQIHEALKSSRFTKINITDANSKNSPFNTSEYICSAVKL